MEHMLNSRVLALLLVLALCLGMIPAAWAEEPAVLEAPDAEPTEAQELVSNADSLTGETGRGPVLLHGDEVVTADDGLQIDGGVLSYEAEHFSPFIVLKPNGDVSNAAASGTWGSLKWSISTDGTLTISGSGEMYGFDDDSNDAWRTHRHLINKVVIESGVTRIGDSAFADCSSLKNVVIPSSVMSIGMNAFVNCSNLTNVLLPTGMTDIGSYAFKSCKSLTSMTIPVGVTNIGFSAFRDCSNLSKITIPLSVTSIEACFYDCDLLKTAGPIGSDSNIQFGWKSTIPDEAFSECNDLLSVVIPEGITKIGNNAFRGCDNLTSVIIPESVTSIGRLAFCYCGNLIDLTLPIGLTNIGDMAFYDCRSLTNIVFPEGVTEIGSRYSYDDNGSSVFAGCTALKSITLPSTLTFIGKKSFFGCSALTSVIIPGGVESIQPETFRGCSSLASLTIREGTTEIGTMAFFDCGRLKTVNLPASVTTIADLAFSECNSISTVNYGGTTAQWKKITIGEGNEALVNRYLGLPLISTQPANVTVGEGQKAVFKVAATGTGLTYQWQCYDGSAWSNVTDSDCNGMQTAALTVPATTARNGYKYRCVVKNAAGKVVSNAAKLTVQLPAPVLKSAASVAGGVKVTWNAVSGASRYAVFRKEEGGSWVRITKTTAVSFTDMTGVPGTTYTYTVRCLSADEKQYLSSYDTAGVSAMSYFATPVLKSAASVAGGVKVTWNAVSGVSAYAVYRREEGGSWARVTKTTAASFTDKTGVPGTFYYYTVRCLTADGKSASGYDKTGAGAMSYFATPVLKSAVSVSGGIKVTWNAVSGAPAYALFRKATGETNWTKIKRTTATSYTDTTAVSGTTYTYTVRCLSADGKQYLSAYDKAGITVLGATPTIKAQTLDVTITAGGRAFFDVTAMGEAMTYRWQYYTGSSWANLSGGDYSGMNTATLTVSAAAAQDGMKFRCRVTNSAGSVYTKTATLHVQG